MTKTPEEIQALREGGAILSRALKAAVDLVRPGVTMRELDEVAEKSMRSEGAEPSFKGYQPSPTDTPFPSTVCISRNEEIVHGIGNRDVPLEEGDIVGLDIGCWYKELCTDMAVTVPVGTPSEEDLKLMQVTYESLMKAIEAVKPGGTIADVGRAVEDVVNPHGYGIVRSLVGHGVGYAVHEPPQVPNYFDKRNEKVKIEKGMVLALEPMLGRGGWEVDVASDGWAMVMADGKTGAHYEVSIAVGEDGAEILTPLPYSPL